MKAFAGSWSRGSLYSLVALIATFAVVYRAVIVKLVHDWATDGNYSHGFLIVPLALYLAWERRAAIAATPSTPSVWGWAVAAASVMVLVTGVLGAELFLMRMSMIGFLIGAILFVGGWTHLRVLAFPVGILLLMVPLPALIFNQIAFPLQLLASRVGEASLSAASIPVLREGNVIVLANTSLEVAEACSGIRSLISLLTLGIVFGYFTDSRPTVRTAIALLTIPIAVVANGLRVAGTGFAAHYFGPAAAEGFFHEFSGWIVFVVALSMLFLMQRFVQKLSPPPAGVPDLSQASAA